MTEKKWNKATQAIHAGEARTSATQKTGTPLLPPIYQNSTFRFATAAECAEAFRDEESGYVYTRLGESDTSGIRAETRCPRSR